MYNDEEQEVVQQLSERGCVFPIPVALTERQLFCLARCYQDHFSTFLCLRVLTCDSFSDTEQLELVSSIEYSLRPYNSLGGYWFDSAYNWNRAVGSVFRDIWIKQILAHYGTTVEEQLELCDVQ